MFLSGSSRRKAIFLPFPSSRSCYTPWILAPFHLQCQQWSPESFLYHHIWILLPLYFMHKNLWLHWFHSDSQDNLPCRGQLTSNLSSTFNLNSPFTMQQNIFTVSRDRCGHFVGRAHSPAFHKYIPSILLVLKYSLCVFLFNCYSVFYYMDIP